MACECAKRALQHNYTHFGLQFYGECWSGPNAATLYNRDGPSSSCIGTDFKPCSSESLCVGGSLTNYVYSVEKVPRDCSEWCKKGSRESGVYEIDPDGKGKFKVFCDMTTDGGGWTLFQKRINGSQNFYLGWDDYKRGFGDIAKEFWLGNDHLHRLTAKQAYILRVDMEDFDGTKKYAAYDAFSIANEAQKYRLTIGTYSGNAGNSMVYMYDARLSHKNMPFTTKDRDNDNYPTNCAVQFKGAWWYNACHAANLNGLYLRGHQTSFADGVNWRTWKGYRHSLKHTEMKIRPRSFTACE